MKSKLITFLWLCTLAVLTACCHKDDPVPSAAVSRTVLIYIAADNDLAWYATSDMEEIRKGAATLTHDNFHLLVYLDIGSKSAPRLVEFSRKNGKVTETVVKTYESRNSVGVEETTEVFNDVFSGAYRADSYGLIYWSHGDGWIPKPEPPVTRWVGVDSNGTDDDDYMNITDLQSILQTAPHFDFILFDACLMQSIEVAYALRSFTDYYIGSPTEIPGPGADYTELVPAMFTSGVDPLTLAQATAAAYYDPYAAIYNGEIPFGDWTGGVSIGILKTAELQSLATVTRQVLSKSVDTETLRADIFNYDKRYNPVGYYDMVPMMRQLTDDAGFNDWKAVYDAAVVSWKTTPQNYSGFIKDMFSMEGTYGVSHYIPSQNAAEVAAYRSTEWCQDAGFSTFFRLDTK